LTYTGTGKLLGGITSVKLFDPAEGTVVRRAQRAERGWWAGAPGACYDPMTSTFYLVYRHRYPRELGRGVECRIAASSDGVSFEDIWALPKTSVNALSIERCALVKSTTEPLWRLYLSWVSPTDGRWRIGVMEATEPDGFSASQLREVMTAESTATEGVKDPNVYIIGGFYYMLFSYAVAGEAQSDAEKQAMHASGDIYNTGLTLSRSGAAVSTDGIHFQILGDVSPTHGASLLGVQAHEPAHCWDSYCRRVGTLLPISSGGYLAYYDGSASVEENYEEQCGAAFSPDLKNFYTLTPDAPILKSGAGTGSIRYVDVLPVGHELFCYYEAARADGSHDLCVNIAELL
jgi:hypothetical protein